MKTKTRRRAGELARPAGRAAALPAATTWLGPSALMDFDDPALCAMARSIAARGKTERALALAAHRKVRALPLGFARQAKPASASQVLRRRSGDAVGKATLLVALLRLCGLPARLLFAAPARAALVGLPADVSCWPRPALEVRIDGDWVRTDTFIFDERYIRAAHHRLRQKERDHGYGVALGGAVQWDGMQSVSILGAGHLQALEAHAQPYNDAQEFSQSLGLIQRVVQVGRWAAWAVRRKRLDRTVRGLRARHPGGTSASASRPSMPGAVAAGPRP